MDTTSEAKAKCSRALAGAQMNGWTEDGLDRRCQTPQCLLSGFSTILLSAFTAAPSQREGAGVSV